DFRSYNHFAAANSFVPDVPPSLFQKSPLEKAASLAEGIKAEMGEGFITSLTESSLMRPFNYLLDQGSHFELQYRRAAWDDIFDNQVDKHLAASERPARTDFKSVVQAAKPVIVANIPELAGLPQEYVDQITRRLTRTIAHPEAYDATVKAIDPGFLNREKMVSIIDEDEFKNLSPAARFTFINGMRTIEPTSTGILKVVKDAIDVDRRLVFASPEYLAEMFKGFGKYIEDSAKKVGFNAEDLANSYNHLRGLQSQLASVPDVLRQAEYEQLQDLMRGPNFKWRREIHNDFNRRMQASIRATSDVVAKSQADFLTVARKYGLETEVADYLNLVKQDQDLLNDTWGKYLSFQDDYLKTVKGNKRAPDFWDTYYKNTETIWSEYRALREPIRMAKEAQDIVIQDKIRQDAVQRGITAATQQVRTKTVIQKEINDIEAMSAGLTGAKKGASTKKLNLLRKELSEAPAGIEPIEPGVDAIVTRVSREIDAGVDPDKIAARDYDRIADDARISGEEPTVNVGRDTSGEFVSKSDPTRPTTAGSNGRAAIP